MRVNEAILDMSPIALGFSGGRDSVSLALWLKEHGISFVAVHVNHQLQEHSDAWQDWCAKWCEERKIPIDVHRVTVGGGNLENAARTARQEVWQQYPVVALCHHQNDQHETFLLRLLRGSSARGLGAMKETTMLGMTHILRPLLNVTRDEITAYVTERGSGWVEDPTNADTSNDRNFLRKELLPLLYRRFDRAPTALNATIRQMQDTAELLDDLARIDGEMCRIEQPEVSLDAVRSLTQERVRNMLRYYLGRRGVQINGKLLYNFVDNLFATDYNGRTEATFGPVSIRQRGRLLMIR